jgi:hypothetical protein
MPMMAIGSCPAGRLLELASSGSLVMSTYAFLVLSGFGYPFEHEGQLREETVGRVANEQVVTGHLAEVVECLSVLGPGSDRLGGQHVVRLTGERLDRAW